MREYPIDDSRYTKRLGSILNSIADGVFTVDNDLHITYFNRAAEKITGISAGEALGRKCFNVLRANMCKDACALRRTIEDGTECINLEVTILNNHDQIIPISISTSALLDEDGEMIGGAETFRDLSVIEILRKEIKSQYNFEDIISKNHEIREMLTIVPDIATSGSTVLIEGPSGSGKELFAKAIHTLSGRSGKFIAVNCAALPDTLLESELFGYKQGAFTEARKDKPGRFALAEGGTLFLDEIGDISTALQVKLLRVLQDKAYEPLGATRTVTADIRIIVATNKNLSELVSRGSFRDDLFYRLNVVRLTLPPLSRRREDIPLLLEHFITKFNLLTGKHIEGLSDEALIILMTHDYPGNVRELENFIEYAFVLCRNRIIDVEHLPKELQAAAPPQDDGDTPAPVAPLELAEARAIREKLHTFGGNRRKTAAHLGINKTTLWRKMKKYGIA